MQTSARPAAAASPAAPLRQPKGLYFLFLTETWERFSFYGMQGLLIFYLSQHFLLTDRQAYEIFGSYVALVYTAPIFGGVVADRWLGLRKAILLGGLMLALGHFGMAYEGHAAVRTGAHGEIVRRDALALQTMFLSLALIALGTGFLKPNISAALGRLYEPHDARRDSGFTLFFLGINLGGMVSALVVGYLGQGVGWRYGFGAAGVGMLIGLAIFLAGQKHLAGLAEPPDPQRLRRRLFGPVTLEAAIYAGALAAVLAAWRLIQARPVLTGVMGLTTLAIAGWLGWFLVRGCSRVERHRTFAALLLTCASVVFGVAVLQGGTTAALFLQRNVDRHLFGLEVQASQFGVFTGLFMLVLTPLFGKLWTTLGRRGREPGSAAQMGLGMIVNGVGFGVLALAGTMAHGPTSVAIGWVVLAIGVNTCGELLVSPSGLSMISKLSPPAILGLMMGVWFLAAAAAGLISSGVASLAAIDPALAADQAPAAALGLYVRLFAGVGAALAATGALLLFSRGVFRRLAHGAD